MGKGFICLQAAQVLRVRAGDVDRDIVGVGINRFQAAKVILRGVFDRRAGIFAYVQSQQHGDICMTAKSSALHMVGEGFQTLVVETESVDQCLRCRQAEHAGFGVAGLTHGRDRTHFDKTKSHGSPSVDATRIFVQARSKTHTVGESQTGQFHRI